MSAPSARKVTYAATFVAAIAVAACQGNVGTGTGLPPPPGSGVTPSAQGAEQSRQKATIGAVFLSAGMEEIPLPAFAGFAVTLYMTPSGEPAASPSAKAKPEHAAASPSPSPAATKGAKSKPEPKATQTPAGPKIDTKTTIYPEGVPAAPTPEPTGDVQQYNERSAIVRGFILPQIDVKLYSLEGVRFKIPALEHPEGRDFTIAVFQSLKHKKWKVLAYDPEATLDGDTVSSQLSTGPILLKQKTGYAFILYGDDLEPTPRPTGTYPPPGQNPFATPGPFGTNRPFGPPTPFTPQTPPILGPH